MVLGLVGLLFALPPIKKVRRGRCSFFLCGLGGRRNEGLPRLFGRMAIIGREQTVGNGEGESCRSLGLVTGELCPLGIQGKVIFARWNR